MLSVNVFLNSVCWYLGLIMCPHMSKADCENYSSGLSTVKCMGVSVCWAGRKPETKFEWFRASSLCKGTLLFLYKLSI